MFDRGADANIEFDRLLAAMHMDVCLRLLVEVRFPISGNGIQSAGPPFLNARRVILSPETSPILDECLLTVVVVQKAERRVNGKIKVRRRHAPPHIAISSTSLLQR